MRSTRRSCPPAWLALWLVFSAAAVAAMAFAAADDRGADVPGTAAGRSAESKERRREGTKFEGSGRFEITGDRVTFYPGEGEESFRVLENLALERVSRVLSETRETREWNVAGVFTEFQSGNYLLLSRAVVRQPAPAKLKRP